MTKEEAKLKIIELIKRFKALDQPKIKSLNEASTKQGFIQPLFEALGWNFTDTDEVSPEDNTSNARVDYAFKLHSVSQFYVEAKSFREDLNDPKYIRQAISYAYNKGVTWAVLTNFHYLRVFNAQKTEPFISIGCDQYEGDFERLWLLSRESLSSGLLNQEAIKWGVLPVPIPIEKRLFAQLRLWREQLFNQIFLYNDKLGLSPEDVDGIIQKLFHRLIFIRTAEDRGIEEKGLLALLHQWKSAGAKGRLIDALRQLFIEYDGYYDSELFDQTLHHLLDNSEIFVQNDVIESILLGLYEIPGIMANYNFNDIDADVLGAVYEQYLGHVAEVMKQQVKKARIKMDLGFAAQTYTLTSKKEHRKEQGIYYTPKVITDFIVRETVGRYLEENAGYADKLHNIKILDPACGSGSFLIRAYDELLKYHAGELNKPLEKLDQWERLPILTNSIFGVDLDKQAVEITRLNLLLRSLAHREPLPFLGDNIKQGNSLISGAEELKKYFGNNWAGLHPFNWQDEFAGVMSKGGFDIIIGNPPYVRIQTLSREEADYYRDIYVSAFGSFDIYIMFVERAMQLLKVGGRLGFITSGKFLTTDYGEKLRELIHQTFTVEYVIDLSAQVVFAEATTYPVIIILRKGNADRTLHYIPVPSDLEVRGDLSLLEGTQVRQDAIVAGVWPPLSKHNKNLFSKIQNNSVSLLELPTAISRGSSTGADEVFCLIERDGKLQTRSHEIVEIEKEILRKPIWATDFNRYRFCPANKEQIIFPYIVSENGYDIIPEEVIRSKFPRTYNYLKSKINILESRKQFNNWYGYSAPRNLHFHDRSQILVPLLADQGRCAPVRLERRFCIMASAGFSISLGKNIEKYHEPYILGLVNSKLLFWYLRQFSNRFRGGWITCTKQYFGSLPIRTIDPTNLNEIQIRDKIVKLVQDIISYQQQLKRNNPENVEFISEIKHKIKQTDESLNYLVYQLYDLTPEDIAIVETKDKE